MSKALTISTKIWVLGPCYLVSCYNKLLWLLFWRLGQNALSCLLYVLWLCEQEVPQHKPWNVFKSNSLIHSKQVTSSKPSKMKYWVSWEILGFIFHGKMGSYVLTYSMAGWKLFLDCDLEDIQAKQLWEKLTFLWAKLREYAFISLLFIRLFRWKGGNLPPWFLLHV